MKLPLLLPLLAITAAKDLSRERREATPLFGNVVDAVTSPFRGFLNLVGFTGASGEKEPEKKPSNSYGAPSYKPAPAYRPAPSYHAPAPAPAYHAPAPSYHAPAPAYHAPVPVVVHHAPKPEIHVLPAPDLSHGPDTYGSPAAPSYSAPPVYTPTSNDPAPVDVITTVKLVEPPAVVEIIPAIEVDPVITNAPLALDPVVVVEEADVVDLRTTEAREPKAIDGNSGNLNQVDSEPGKALEGKFVPVQSDIIIDLTENKDNANVAVEAPAPPPAFEGLAPAPAPAFEEPAARTIETTVAPTQPTTLRTTTSPPEPTTIRVIHFTREPVSSPGDTFFRTANSGLSDPVQQSSQLRIETTAAPVDLPATAPAFVETPAPAVAETIAPISSETPAPAPAFEETPAPAPAFTTTITAAGTTEASNTQQVTEVQTDATTTSSPVTPILPGENLRAAVTVIDLTETPTEALDYEELALVDDVNEPIQTTLAATVATEAPVVRKVFFEIIDGSAAKAAENESEATAAPTVAAIPEAISTDPVFQEIARDAVANEQQKRGFRAYDPRQSQVYAHKYNDANSNWYYFRRGY